MSFAFPLVPSGTLRPSSFGVQEVAWRVGVFFHFWGCLPTQPLLVPVGIPQGCWAAGAHGKSKGESPLENQGLHWNTMARCGPLGLVAPGAARTPPSFPEAGDGNCPVLLQLLLGQLTAHMARAGKAPWECQEPVRDQHPLWRGHSPIFHLLLPRGTHSHLRQSPVLPSRLGDPCGHQQWPRG